MDTLTPGLYRFHVHGAFTPAVIRPGFKLYSLPAPKRFEAVHFDLFEVDEIILLIFANDESISLCIPKPLHFTFQ